LIARIIRLTLGFLVPILGFALVASLVHVVMGSSRILDIFIFVLYGGIMLAGIQTLAYTIVMEFVVMKYVKTSHGVAFVSGMLGILVSLSAGLALYGINLRVFVQDPYVPVVGFILGVALGYGLKYYYNKSQLINI